MTVEIKMASADQALSEFIDAWNAGERPEVNDYLERVPEGERDELAGLLAAFLEWAPPPTYTEQQRQEIARDPAVSSTLNLIEGPGLWPALLPSLRRRARITRDQVVERLADMLGVSGKEARVRVYYHEMESGTLDPGGVSQRVIDALASIFGVSSDEIADAGELGAPAAAAGGVYLRAEMDVHADDAEYERAPRGARQSPGDWDEVDQL